MKKCAAVLLVTVLLCGLESSTYAFIVSPPKQQVSITTSKGTWPLFLADTSVDTPSRTREAVAQLKKVLEREYVTFFDPMKTEWYSKQVTFDDPLISLAGTEAYQNNVDMLAGRTLMGSILFEDGGINLHSVTGGEVGDDGSISDITTRWTLRFTMKVLPWKPTARFSGISVYNIRPSSSSEGVEIVGQTDYWDSINLKQGGKYERVNRGAALKDFIDQLKPGGFQASAAAPELPYQLLRRGNGYEIRRYPAYSGIRMRYNRRDEGFGSLGSFTKDTESPLGPAIMEVEGPDEKYMQWPLLFAKPGSGSVPTASLAMRKSQEPQWNKYKVENFPSRVIAVTDYSDASMEPVVRKADRDLRKALKRDGLKPAPRKTESSVTFAQYDAIFSMGKRRSEVWVELAEGGHHW